MHQVNVYATFDYTWNFPCFETARKELQADLVASRAGTNHWCSEQFGDTLGNKYELHLYPLSITPSNNPAGSISLYLKIPESETSNLPLGWTKDIR
jgi:hypothetical protein